MGPIFPDLMHIISVGSQQMFMGMLVWIIVIAIADVVALICQTLGMHLTYFILMLIPVYGHGRKRRVVP